MFEEVFLKNQGLKFFAAFGDTKMVCIRACVKFLTFIIAMCSMHSSTLKVCLNF